MPVEITDKLLKAAVLKLAEITGEKSFVIVGSGSLAITAPQNYQSLARTDDVDMWPRDNEAAGLDICIEELGEGSRFHAEYGFYIERVGSWTLLTQPVGWEARATRVIFDDVEVLALGLLDLVYNKLEANRKKDRIFLKNAIDNALIDIIELKKFILENAPNDDVKESLLVSLEELTQRR